MGVYTNNLSGVPVGLGMAGAKDKHQDLGNALVGNLYKICLKLGFLIGSEYRNEEEKNDTEIADVLIKKRHTKERVVVIELCSNDTYKNAINRIQQFYNKHPNTMQEAFIFNFDDEKWECYTKDGKKINDTFCFTINKDLKKVLENTEIYNDYF